MARTHVDPQILAAALVGLQHQRDQIDAKMAEIRGALGTRSPAPSAAVASAPQPTARKRGRLRPAARRRIAAAQRKRWAAYHKAQKQPKAVPPAKEAHKTAPAKTAAKRAGGPAKKAAGRKSPKAKKAAARKSAAKLVGTGAGQGTAAVPASEE